MRTPRLGCVPYLNARPLIHGLETTLAVPSLLAQRFLAGDFDAALIPVFETLRLPRPRIVDGYGIGSAGPVHSVIVAHRLPLRQTPEIVLDPSSRTSVHLLRILLSEHLKLPVRLVSRSGDPLAARLMIGDPAIEFQKSMDPAWEIFDLGESWLAWTGLPFVYAVWTLADDAPAGTASLLRKAARDGLEVRPEIAARESDPPAAFDYLTRSIHYPMGFAEKEGINSFRRCLISQKLLPAEAGIPVYV